jgi:hypothetical protein
MKVLKVIDAIKPLVNPHSVLDVLAVIETLRVSEVITFLEAKAASHVICNYQAEDRVHWFAELESALRQEELKMAIREAVAQGYCTKANRNKVLDPELVMDISGIVFDLVRHRLLKTRLGIQKDITYPKAVSRIASKVFRERLDREASDRAPDVYPGSEHEFQPDKLDKLLTGMRIGAELKPVGAGKGHSEFHSGGYMTDEELLAPTASQMGLSKDFKNFKDNGPL